MEWINVEIERKHEFLLDLNIGNMIFCVKIQVAEIFGLFLSIFKLIKQRSIIMDVELNVFFKFN